MRHQFYLLGDFRAMLGEEQLPLPPFRTHGLLSLLLLRPDIGQRRKIVGYLEIDQKVTETRDAPAKTDPATKSAAEE